MGWLNKLVGKASGSSGGADNLVRPETVVFAVGDVHGRLDLLQKLMDDLHFRVEHEDQSDVRLVFLGDYIDRGFQSNAVLDYMTTADWGRMKPYFLKGNHEQTLLDFLERPDVGARWIEYGGRETLLSYGVPVPGNRADVSAWEATSEAFLDILPQSHLNFLVALKSCHQIDNCYFVHAGVDPASPLSMQTDEDRLWIRDKFLSSSKRLEKIIVHGHTPEEAPTWNGRRIGVDTGAYITNKLTAVRICGSVVDFIST